MQTVNSMFNARRAAAVVFVTFLLVRTAAAVDVADIRSPRPHGWTTDLTGRVPRPAQAELNKLCDELNRQHGAEMAVVVVGTIGGENHRAFATRLFNHWGIGSAQRDNGILIFAALDDRKAEIILGDGIDEAHQVRAADQIMQNQMVPRFKRGDVAGGLTQAAWSCATRILAAEGLLLEAPPDVADPPPAIQPPPPAVRPVRRRGRWGIANWLFGVLGGGALLAGLVYGVRRYRRFRTRRCSACSQAMLLLGEAEDDQHLEKAERLEERLGSADYDVWACPACDGVIKLRYVALLTRYAQCPSCSYKTKSKVNSTVRAATTVSSGLVRVDESCENCSYSHSHTYSTPRLSDRSSSSSSFGSSSFGSSSSSSGFSGGSSSGSGSSGSW
ncbi:MAG: TPM domain-containing protein [Planctomycetota bacterium]|nr:TPM domain-containing protein [Planctomycetota bacterium]